jgi:hypothetical protein
MLNLDPPVRCGPSPVRHRRVSLAGLAGVLGNEPLVGSPRFVNALKTVLSPITTNVIVMEALALSVLGSSGPATRGVSAARNRTTP